MVLNMLDIKKLIQGDNRTAAKLITLIENNGDSKQELLSRIYPYTGKAHVIGITGSPGSGKSSLVEELIETARGNNLKVGVIAVDPTSPISGGAFLGDRVRMQKHSLDKNVFIRSMGTRGCLGGLARASKDVIKVLDAYGCNIIIVETVGVGQSEMDVVYYADTTIVVLTPGAGDFIQAIKAGIMEIADIFVINKSDLGDTKKVAGDIEQMLDLNSPSKFKWRPPVVETSTITKEGIDHLWSLINKHLESIKESGEFRNQIRKRLQLELLETVEEKLREYLVKHINQKDDMDKVLDDLADRKTDLYAESDKMIIEALKSLTGEI
ncbi:LAO/AO transport system kinase [Desulfotomaculum arcticum]|uniref:LAO/AO transport system kinase n=2 Tax=Desulfotruncus TaxID=2867377 RepID=A0A1I2XM49_9FIRM|nr:LAO/AO transport system kinase [Desulfotomaculum arcticum] [Desulfotruncus arcticus DSM 17038]